MEDIAIKQHPFSEILGSYINTARPVERESEPPYLDMAEHVIRIAARWLDEDGAMIDPVHEREMFTATARYVGTVAWLVAQGRCRDLVESTFAGMDRMCRQLQERQHVKQHLKLRGSEFYTKELANAYKYLGPFADASRREQWKSLLSDYDPNLMHVYTLHNCEPDRVRNHNVYALVGEYLKKSFGITESDDGFVEKHLKHQFNYFTEAGLYQDPLWPTNYDLTVRQNLALLLAEGYDGPSAEKVSEIVRAGALTALLYLSPTGNSPCGGRNNQYLITEGMIACFCEYVAQQYFAEGEEVLAGLFQNLAEKAARVALPWLVAGDSFYHNKNRFSMESYFGCDSWAGYVTAYAPLAANLFACAAYLRKQSLPLYELEPGKIAYHLDLTEHNRKAIFTDGNYYVQLETDPNYQYESRGINAFHRKGFSHVLGLNQSFVLGPKYSVPGCYRCEDFALGPLWLGADKSEKSLLGSTFTGDWKSLADRNTKVNDITIAEEGPKKITVTYQVEDEDIQSIQETIEITDDHVSLHYSAEGNCRGMAVSVPVFYCDGEVHSAIKHYGHCVTATYQGQTMEARLVSPNDSAVEQLPIMILDCDYYPSAEFTKKKYANRNGLYRISIFKQPGKEITVSISIAKGKTE